MDITLLGFKAFSICWGVPLNDTSVVCEGIT